MEKCNFSSFFSILFIRNGFAKLHWFGNTEIHPPPAQMLVENSTWKH